MDGFVSGLSGMEIDKALRNAAALTIVSNGWAKIPSTADNPVSINSLVSPGNYTVDYWTDGPTVAISPLNVNVFTLDSKVTQTIAIGDTMLTRTRKDDGTFDAAWTMAKTKADIYVQATPPTTINESTLWVDTSNMENGVVTFRLPKNPESTTPDWLEIKPIGTMTTDVYDPTGQATDLFKYVKDTIDASGAEASGMDFDAHVKNEDIHVTQAEVTDWNNRPTQNDVTTKIDEIKVTSVQAVKDSAAAMSGSTTALAEKVTEYKGLVEAHTGNTTIHPSAEVQATWTAKAAPDHTHKSDGTVEIDASKVVSGVFSLDRIDKSALERLITVDNDATRLKLTKADAQDGDCIYVNDPDQPAFYYIIDDTKLATTDPAKDAEEAAFKLFSAGTVAMTWENLADKPTTVAGYGITDVYTKAEVDASVKTVSDVVDSYAGIAATSGKYSTAELDSLKAQITAISNANNILSAEQAKIDGAMPDIIAAVDKLNTLL